MQLSEIKNQVKDLQLILIQPKLFITNYFDDLINQVDIQILKFEQKNGAKEDGKDCGKNIDVENWRQLII